MGDWRAGHREPIESGLLIGEESAGKPRTVILCKATFDSLIIKMN